MMAVLSVPSVTTSFVSCLLPLPFACSYKKIKLKNRLYIVIRRQIFLVLSELIRVARHTSFPCLGSKSG